MPKVIYATTEALEGATITFEEKLNEVRNEVAPVVKAAETRLQGAISAVAEQQTRDKQMFNMLIAQTTKDLKAYADKGVADLAANNRREHEKMTQEFNDVVAQEKQQLENQIKAVDGALRHELAETVKELCKNFEDELNSLKAELQDGIVKASQEAADNLAKQRTELDAENKKLDKMTKKLVNLTKEGYEKEVARLEADYVEKDKAQDEYNQRVQNDIFLKLDAQEELITVLTKTTEKKLQATVDKIQEMIDELIRDHGGRLNWLEGEADKIRDAVSEVESYAVRRVDWVIKDASDVIRPQDASKACLHRSWFSPKFNLAGCHGLQLELQYFRPSDPPAPGEADGDAAVYLWAAKATNISYRIYIGGKYVTMDKIFNGRVPYGTKRFCWLSDQINRKDNTLSVSVEILESHRKVEHVIAMPPEPTEPLPPGASPPEKPLEGIVHFHRHVNNRLLDQVKNQVELMRSRLIRKVEWRVEHANKLRSCFGPGEAICSSQFNAAGIEGLQLMFYPSGYKGCTDGFCSLYLYGPAGCTLRCFLCLGVQKREAHHAFEEPGAFGRTNFCRFESVIEEDNSVIVCLEIEEAHQDLVAKVAHPLVVPGDRRSQNDIDGGVSGPITSIVKLQGNQSKQAKGLEETRVLPSLWTAHYEGTATDMSGTDGMFTWEDLKTKAKGALKVTNHSPAKFAHADSASNMTSPQVTKSFPGRSGDWSAMKSGGGSMPLLTGSDGSPTSRLPQMSRTAGFSDHHPPAASGPRPRRPRGGGSLANTSPPAMAAY
eukprot:TRINITY_DN7555_c1_g1_i1.p1 TRINITY_DN7555_c1_g1~~TRINITY_DN7555_c1_g1_i1.p1  ORF type:complete len:775 (+),score=217.28 TRINITY_DN7555_c1_g1_i1:162-2486(+)